MSSFLLIFHKLGASKRHRHPERGFQIEQEDTGAHGDHGARKEMLYAEGGFQIKGPERRRRWLCAGLSGVRLGKLEIGEAEREQQPDYDAYPDESIESPGHYIEDANKSGKDIADDGAGHKRAARIGWGSGSA